jgi:hypothetical protein
MRDAGLSEKELKNMTTKQKALQLKKLVLPGNILTLRKPYWGLRVGEDHKTTVLCTRRERRFLNGLRITVCLSSGKIARLDAAWFEEFPLRLNGTLRGHFETFKKSYRLAQSVYKALRVLQAMQAEDTTHAESNYVQGGQL